MKLNIKHQYTLIQSLYWISGSILFGYTAVLLYHKGLSETLVGVAVGSAACFLIFAQPFVDNLVQKLNFLTPKKMILILMLTVNILYFILGILPLPQPAVILLFILVHSLFNCATPLITTVGMEYLNQGYEINFFFSRGMGSLSYAVSAFIMGYLVEYFRPGVLPYAFAVTQGLLFLLVLSIKEPKPVTNAVQKDTSSGFLQILKEHRTVRLFAIGFCLSYMANSMITTYMVNIVYNAGGTDSSFGLCCFCNAASEFPAMLLFGWLLHRFSCKTLLKVSSFFFILKMVVIFMADNLFLVYFGYLLQSVSFGGFNVVFVFLINSELAPKERMRGQSIFAIVTTGIGGCLGNFAGGAIQGTWGLQAMIGFCIALTLAGFFISMCAKSKSY